MLLAPSQHSIRAEAANTTESYENRMPFFIALKRGFAFRSTTTLAAKAFSTPANVINLDEILERLDIICFFS